MVDAAQESDDSRKKWKATGCLFCQYTSGWYHNLNRKIVYNHLVNFCLPNVPVNPQPRRRGPEKTPRISVDGYHHAGIIRSVLYSSEDSLVMFSTVHKIEACPRPPVIPEPSQEEIRSFVLNQFGQVAMMAISGGTKMLKHHTKALIPSAWWEDKVIQAMSLVTLSIKHLVQGISIICINDFINDTLYQAEKMWYNHPGHFQLISLDKKIKKIKHSYVYGNKPQDAGTAGPRNGRNKHNHKPAMRLCELPEKEYGLDKYEDDEEPKIEPPANLDYSPGLYNIPAAIKNEILIDQKPRLPIPAPADKKRKASMIKTEEASPETSKAKGNPTQLVKKEESDQESHKKPKIEKPNEESRKMPKEEGLNQKITKLKREVFSNENWRRFRRRDGRFALSCPASF